MKTFKFTIFILTLCILITHPCFAKKGLDEQNQSVQLLKTLTNEGKVIRQNDEPVEKADISEDTVLVKNLKQQYYEKNQYMFDAGKTKNRKQKTKKSKKIPE